MKINPGGSPLKEWNVGNRRLQIIYLVLGLVTLALYAPVLHHSFIVYDDYSYVVDNKVVKQGFTPRSVVWAFTSGRQSNWHPLTWLSHMLDVQLYGIKNPGAHHFTNLIFHIADIFLLFAVLRRMTGAIWRSALVAALFAWHPLHIQSVAWVAERKDVLSAFFWLLTMLFYARYVDASKIDPRKARTNYIWMLVSFALGLMSKPMLVTLPFALLLLDYWPLRRPEYLSARNIETSKDTAVGAGRSEQIESVSLFEWFRAPIIKRLVIEKIPLLALAFISSLVTFFVQRAGGAVSSFQMLPLSQRLTNALVSYVAYLQKTFVPYHLAIFYPLIPDWSVTQIVVSCLVLIGITALALTTMRSRPWFIVGWLWYLGTLVPVIGLVQVGAQSMADRYTYLPLIGIFIALVWGFGSIASARPEFARAIQAVAILALLACIVDTTYELKYWKNTETLFRRDLEITSNNAVAHFNLARALDEKGERDKGGEEFTAALRANPAAPIALVGIGRHYADETNNAAAIEYYDRALKINPGYADAHFDLGNIFARQGKYSEAAEQFEATLRIDSDAADAENNLGAMLLRMGRTGESVKHFERAIELQPAFPEVQDELGGALLALGQTRQARIHYAEAVRQKPDFVHARMKYGLLLGEDGDLDQAIIQFQNVLQLEPQNAEAVYDLAATFAGENRLDEAAAEFAAVANMRPTDPDSRVRFAAILTAQAKYETAIVAYRDALRLKPDSAEAMKGLAWILATAPKPEIRNGAEAVRLAEKANDLTGHKQPGALAALDVAYAEAGRFDDAVKAVQETAKQAMAQNNTEVAASATKRLELYRAGKPFHQ